MEIIEWKYTFHSVISIYKILQPLLNNLGKIIFTYPKSKQNGESNVLLSMQRKNGTN
jgi:hypothetical protein